MNKAQRLPGNFAVLTNGLYTNQVMRMNGVAAVRARRMPDKNCK